MYEGCPLSTMYVDFPHNFKPSYDN